MSFVVLLGSNEDKNMLLKVVTSSGFFKVMFLEKILVPSEYLINAGNFENVRIEF